MSCPDGSCEFQPPINRPAPEVSLVQRRYALLWMELSEAEFRVHVRLKLEEAKRKEPEK